MSLILPAQRELVRAVASLADCNPFLPERLEIERRILGSRFVPSGLVWHAGPDMTVLNPNTAALQQIIEPLGKELRQRLVDGIAAEPAEALADYHRLVLYLLFLRYEDPWYYLIEPRKPDKLAPEPLEDFPPELTAKLTQEPIEWYSEFADAVEHFYAPAPALREGPERIDAPHLFALGFQVRRAFHYIFRQIFGSSLPAARLRAIVWNAIFTVDMQSYREGGYRRMADVSVLIIGETGSGKDLVARGVALSCYLPFDAKRRVFAADPAAGFCALNLSELNPGLIEAKLFGHRRGTFTGAEDDRIGWFERGGGRYGTVFLDEIGDTSPDIQKKLLRVLQNREFHSVGDRTRRRFLGRVIAATHRNLRDEIVAGRFRADLFFRLRSSRLEVPTLRDQLADTPGDLHHLIRVLAERIIGSPGAEKLAARAQEWVDTRLPRDYGWPGNIRELEQCVRDIWAQGQYVPDDLPVGAAAPSIADSDDDDLTADQVVQRHCAAVYAKTRSYQETAQLVRLDRRTVRAKVQAWNRRKTPRGGK